MGHHFCWKRSPFHSKMGPHWVAILKCFSPTFPLFGRSLTQCSHCAYPYIHQRSRMRNPEEPNAEQEPNAEHHVAKFLVEVLILRSICGPLKRKLMAFSCHIQLSRVPPRCVMLWRSPEMNFTRRPRVAKLLCIGSPLNRSRDITYCNLGFKKLDSQQRVYQMPVLVKGSQCPD